MREGEREKRESEEEGGGRERDIKREREGERERGRERERGVLAPFCYIVSGNNLDRIPIFSGAERQRLRVTLC
jgi:hypothetical protein